VHARLARQVARTPDAVAVECGPESLTYAELDRRASELSTHLLAHGVGVESVVGLCLHRGVDLVVAMLAIIKSGAAYLPMDPANPAERLRYMLAAVDARAVVTSRALADIAHRAGAGRARLLVDELPPAAPGSPVEAPRVAGENTLYVIFTSGSTGRPKGVAVPHRALLNLFDWYLPDTGMGPGDAQLGSHSISFDPAALEILFPLLNGARLVVSPDGAHADPDALLNVIADAGATVINVGPSTLSRFLDEPGGADRMRGLRIVVSGGERLAPGLRDRFLAALPDTRLVNHYGPTETTVFATSWDPTAADGDVVPIGPPIGGVHAYVLDEAMAPVPEGTVGELHIGGAGLARGYANMPRLTAEAFVPDPFSGLPGARMYRTGDQARVLAGGALEFLGRGDDQVKLRGYRIELGEVEATISRHPAVGESAVVLCEGSGGSAVLAAFVEHDGSTSVDALRAHLRRDLPEHMIPGHLELVDRLPRTVTGKVDKSALSGRIAPDADARPANETERVLAEIWAHVLALPRVGVHDDFFALGGDSLLATRAVAGARRALGRDVPLVLLYERRSVAAVAAALEEGADDRTLTGTAINR
jgi:amino acid adenylation domain-containing protein